MSARQQEQKQAPVRAIFFGTPSFVLPVVEGLHCSPLVELVGIVTQPDKPSGRKKTLLAPPIKRWANEQNIRVFQPESTKDERFHEQLKSLTPDLFVVAGYGQFLPRSLFSLPKHDSINIHPSLLPAYRGPTPIQVALLDEQTESGVSLILVREKMDAGPLLAQQEFSLGAEKTAAELYPEAFAHGTELLLRILPAWIQGTHTATEQPHEQATICKLLKKEDGRVDWTQVAQQIVFQWRALHPWPGVYTTWNGKRLKLLHIQHNESTSTGTPGTFVRQGDALFVQTTKGRVEILQLQLEGKQSQSAIEFMRGYAQLLEGTRFE